MSVVAKDSSSYWILVLVNRAISRTVNSSQHQLNSQTGASDLPVHSDSYDCPSRETLYSIA